MAPAEPESEDGQGRRHGGGQHGHDRTHDTPRGHYSDKSPPAASSSSLSLSSSAALALLRSLLQPIRISLGVFPGTPRSSCGRSALFPCKSAWSACPANAAVA